jgi:hypothetical protein
VIDLGFYNKYITFGRAGSCGAGTGEIDAKLISVTVLLSFSPSPHPATAPVAEQRATSNKEAERGCLHTS